MIVHDSLVRDELAFGLPATMTPEEGCELIARAHDFERPEVLFRMLVAKVATETLRAALAEIWGHDHHYLFVGFTRPYLRQIMRQYGTLPATLPTKLTVWRGGPGPAAKLRRGWSWTTDRGAACWFATQWRVNQARLGTPLVLRSEIDAADIVHHDPHDSEFVIFGARNARRDPVADWQDVGDEWERRKNANQMAWLAAPEVVR